ncbi:GTP 3',8-cyclase MoaA [Candidatus Poribacteria bacterium]|nr:GTP 3',8-cyclase MoaA [Candidatus Poribacteria bacterium]
MNDKYGRKIDYLRISVTDRCNLRCVYCMPEEGISLMNHKNILRYEEIIKISSLAYELGFRKFRITGGEPLARKGLTELIKSISCLGNDIDLALTTNGTLLTKYVHELKDAGLKRLNISLDTLDREKFQQITRFDLFQQVIEGINLALEVAFDPIKINVVVVKGINDDEILDFVELTREKKLWVRFIELMPFSRNNWSEKRFVSADEIRAIIENQYKLIEIKRSYSGSPSYDYSVDGHKGKIGFIASLSHKFCDQCNRLRLTADGRLLPCLHSDGEIDIKTPLRSGGTDDEIKAVLHKAMLAKPQGHRLCENGLKITNRNMSKVGG